VMGDAETKGVICCVLTFIITLVSCVLLACSFAILKPLQMGIAIDNNLLVLDDSTTWFSGRRFVGLGRSFIKFPITYDMVQYADPGGVMQNPDSGPVKCRSSDGLPVTVQGSFAYILSRDPKDLVRLYRAVGEPASDTDRPWHEYFVKMGLAAIRDVTANYAVEDFFPKREQIASDMQTSVANTLLPLYAYVHTFDLVDMGLVQPFADAIEITQVQYQDNEKAFAERQVVIIQAEQNLSVIEKTAEVLNATAYAMASQIMYIANANAGSLLAVTEAQSERLLALKTQLNFSSADQLLDYIFISSVGNTGAGNMLLNMPIPASVRGPTPVPALV